MVGITQSEATRILCLRFGVVSFLQNVFHVLSWVSVLIHVLGSHLFNKCIVRPTLEAKCQDTKKVLGFDQVWKTRQSILFFWDGGQFAKAPIRQWKHAKRKREIEQQQQQKLSDGFAMNWVQFAWDARPQTWVRFLMFPSTQSYDANSVFPLERQFFLLACVFPLSQPGTESSVVIVP